MDNIIKLDIGKQSDKILEYEANTPEELIEFINKYKDSITCYKTIFSFNLPEEDSILTKSLVLSNSEFNKQQAQEMVNFDIKVSCDFLYSFLNDDSN